MKRLRILLLLLACTALLAGGGYYWFSHTHSSKALPAPETTASPGPPPDLVHQLPPGASAILFADVAALRKSHFAADLTALAPSRAQDPNYTAFVRATGFDYTRDLDRLAMALWPRSSATTILAIAEGRFDQQKIARYALHFGTVVNRSGAKVYEVREQNPPKKIYFSFLAPSRIAIADGPEINAVLEPGASSRLDSATAAQVAHVAGATIFAVAHTKDLPRDLGIESQQNAQLDRLLSSVRNLTFAGQPAGERLDVALDAECDSKLDAFQLAALLDSLRWLARAALADPRTRQRIGPQAPALDTLLRIADISHREQWVRIQFAITPKMLAGGNPAPLSKNK